MGTWATGEVGFKALQDLGNDDLLIAISGFMISFKLFVSINFLALYFILLLFFGCPLLICLGCK